MGRVRELGSWALAAAALALGCALAPPAAAGGLSYLQMPARGGIALEGSPYRWVTISPPGGARTTVVERIDRRGGEVSRWWSLRGAWHLSAPAYDLTGAGLAGDESVLVLQRFDPAPRGLRRRTHLAILDTGPHRRDGRDSIRHLTLPGDYGVYAISPDGSTLYLVHTLSFRPQGLRFTIQPYDLRARELLPAVAIRSNEEIHSGTAAARLQDVSGHRVYTLNADGSGRTLRMYLLALDTFGRTLSRVELPQLRGQRNPFMLRLHLDAAGHHLTISARSETRWVETGRSAGRSVSTERPVTRIDLRKLPQPPQAAPIGIYSHTVGESVRGRPIEMVEVGDLSLPGRILVFGCIHGDECGAAALEPLRSGCPDPYLHAYLVPNLDPDGSAVKSRLNARGVDLNRNFAAGWRPLGSRGSPEYSGPWPFSEPETRLAARLIRRIQPRLTIWFHQHSGGGTFARAWGQSVPAARRFAKLAGIGFRLLRWPAGTGPNWQNHRFPGTASFVVEAPRGRLGAGLRVRLTAALSRLGEEVGEDPHVPPKG